ncbi:4772_t:CDS:10 [Ambispora gerdemannii]|uniref:4772_t:CDS:1 n=1 Tax=Ambispora gerdemannii TaxID=144530 RepID=A0A9N8ZP20_9GLOM|nr:4772_t:CDS:10 [Ambispora gerdemannii]
MEEEQTNINRTFRPTERIFRLPFEFNEDDRLGPWDILISEDAIKDISRLTSPLEIEAVMKKLGKISSGAWNKHGLNFMVIYLPIPVYKAELRDHGDIKILWQIDYGFSTRSYLLTQLVKVWAVTANQNRFDKILEYLRMLHQFYTAEQRCRCAIRQISRNDIILPKIFEEEELKSTENEIYSCQMDDEQLLVIHNMLVANKFVPLSKNLFKSLVMDGTGFTFQVSKVEYESIKNPTSAIIIGRSGTGKTTCIVYRLIASYLSNSSNLLYKTSNYMANNRNQDSSHMRQIFITVSHILCRQVKEYFYRLRKSAILAETKMTIDQFHEYVRKKEKEYDTDQTDNKMLEEGDEEKELSHIPNSFSQLTEDHFPLFITYEKFSKMLEGTYGIDGRKLTQQSKINKDHFVDFNVFKKRYWNRLNDDKFDCELVYSEFSIIKGSNPEGKYLSREDYRTVSIKKYPAFCYNRDIINDLFQRYEKMKSLNGDYDSIDRTLAILSCAIQGQFESLHIHEIYIDECQDNQIVDLGLILKIFDRVDSIFLAGDIAQCIAKGSSFRFQDIRALMYKWELTRIQANNISQSTMKPNQFELNVNYRSHNGILRLAASIIDLIWDFFPESIDCLSRERGEVGGPRPIVFKGFQAETFHFNVFPINKKTGKYIEFGAEQVIIVRDEVSKLRLQSLIGKAGLIMTVYEAKGMEFNDVLLYNFFTDSPGGQKWRLILSALDNQSERVPKFSHEKHYMLSSELKHLYVAVTRARRHIWIFDEKNERIEPICKYWEHHGLVKVIQNEDEIIFPELAKQSSPAEWNREGKKYFELRQYNQAIFCFKKGKNPESRRLAKAYYLQQIARDSINSDLATVISNFNRAGDAFRKCARLAQAVSCYENTDMYEKTAKIYIELNKFESAAHCYLKIPDFETAGKWFEKANKYTEAVVAYKDGRCYENVINLMESHREKIDEKKFNRITHLVNIHYRRVNNRKMSEKALSIFPTLEKQVNFLREHAPEELPEFCKKNDLLHVAAEDLRLRGRFNEAVNVFPRLVDNDDYIIEYLRCCLDLCRVKVLKMTMADLTNSNSSELNYHLSKAINVITKVKSQTWKKSEECKSLNEEFQLYLAYLYADLDVIRKFMQLFRKRENCIIEFRAVIIWLRISKSTENWQEHLQCLLRMCELAFPFLAQINKNIAKSNKDFQGIFAVSEVENRSHKRKIVSDNCLAHLLNQNNVEILDGWHVYDEKILNLAISQFLASYIYEHIWEAGQRGREIQEISSEICFKFASCSRHNCRKHHVVPTPSILRKRFSLACLQYNVMQKLDVLYYRRLLKEEQSKNVRGSQRWWAERLVKIHLRYQSPQTSCPEITYAMLPKHTRCGLIDLSHKIWLPEVFNKPDDFSIMLKCILVLHQLHDSLGIKEFDWKIRHPEELSIGFDYFGCDESITHVVKQLSLFFSHLYNNRVLDAIKHIKMFIQYTIEKTELVNIITPDDFGDLIFLMEFKTSLIFAVGPGYCDFCLPRAYLVNYFNAFTAGPLIDNQHGYNRVDYQAEIGNSIDQVQQLINLLIYMEKFYLTIILRLIRLLVLICLNEPTFTTKIFNLFKHWSKHLRDKVFSLKLNKYLNENCMDRLVIILHNDLKETDCDSLIIVHYHLEGSSKFSGLEKHGIVKLKYTSAEEFHLALQQVISPIVSQDSEKLEFSKETQDSATEIQNWFHQIHNSLQAKESVTKIQVWFRRALQRQKSRQHRYDTLLETVFNNMAMFCNNEIHWNVAVKEKGKKTVNKYHLLLRGPVVKNIVDLTNMQGKMNAKKNKFQKIKNSLNDEKLEKCFELLEDLKYIHNENIVMALDSLENMTKHQEANIVWLINESQMAEDFLNAADTWINEWNDAMKK